jgi:SAM-dependent methyltransferase
VSFADAKQRFSSRVADYVRYRPGYPDELIGLLHAECGLQKFHQVADIGSGTGLLSKLFARNGNPVLGVEPNDEMREAGEEFLAAYPNFTSVKGSAEATSIADECIDFITAGQAFHWFEPSAARKEFLRILKPGGWVAIVWNDRKLSETEFGRAYEDLLVRYGTDYTKVKDAYPEALAMERFFAQGKVEATAEPAAAGLPHSTVRRRELANFQEFDFAGLAGRLRSSSYAPKEGDTRYAPMMEELRKLFDANQRGGSVRMEYTTQIYFGRLG